MGALARARKAKLLVLAADAADNTLRRCSHFAQAGRAPLLQCPFTKAELGLAAGKGSCALLPLEPPGKGMLCFSRRVSKYPVKIFGDQKFCLLL